MSWFNATGREIEVQEVWAAVRGMGKNKAPGPTGITKELIMGAGEECIKFLQTAYQICMEVGDSPNTWAKSTMCPIPKTADWGGDLSKVRPIVLVEVAAKGLESIWATRLQAVFLEHPHILRGQNFSVLPRTSTDAPLVMMKAVLDTCKETGRSAILS